jgi:hypothetical protein
MFESLFGSGKKKPTKEPATDKQKQFAKKLGVRNSDSLSKEEASKQIDKKLAARNRRGEGLLAHLEGRIDALEKTVGKKPVKRATKKKKK